MSEVAKAGAAKWGQLDAVEKKPYEEQAAQKKVRAAARRPPRAGRAPPARGA